MTNNYDELQKLAEAADLGPLAAVPNGCADGALDIDTPDGVTVLRNVSKARAKYIAALVNAAPALLSELTALRAAASAPKAELTDERAAFETWAIDYFGGSRRTRQGDGYLYADINCAWRAWQARAVLAQAAPVARPTDDELWDQTLCERDTYHEWADKLAGAIGTYFGADVGEHSNQNCPWAEALEVIDSARNLEKP